MTGNKPIDAFKLLGFLFFLLTGCLHFIMLLVFANEIFNQNHPGIGYFIAVVVFLGFLHFLIALGLRLEKKWGFLCLKIYLGLSLLAFPIGTYFGIKISKFIKNYNIKEEFYKII